MEPLLDLMRRLFLLVAIMACWNLHGGQCREHRVGKVQKLWLKEFNKPVADVRNRRSQWSCPQVTESKSDISCQCDLPHTLRCAGLAHSTEDIESIVNVLRTSKTYQSVSLLDLSIQNLSRVSSLLFDKVTLHGLVISSGEIRDVSELAFSGLETSLTALGLPNNRLTTIPFGALKILSHLERLDLSNNRIHTIPSHMFIGLENLRFLDLNGNAIQTLSPDSFSTLVNLRSLHLRSNLLVTSQLNPSSLKGLKKLQELDLAYNQLRGRWPSSFLQELDNLVTLDLSVNNLTLLKRGMLSGLKHLTTIHLAHNQVSFSPLRTAPFLSN